MKKLFLLILLMFVSLPAFSVPDAGIIQVHDMQMINQQRFRMQEINDYKEVKEEKARFEKRIAPSKPVENCEFNTNEKPKFIEENGEIKILRDDY